MAGATPSLVSTAIRPRWRGKLTCHMRIYAHLRKRLLHSPSLSLHFFFLLNLPRYPSFPLFLCLCRDTVLHKTINRQLHEDLGHYI